MPEAVGGVRAPGPAAPVLRAPSPGQLGRRDGAAKFRRPAQRWGRGERRGGKAPQRHRALPGPQLAHLSPGSPVPRGGGRGGERAATPAGLACRLRAPAGRPMWAALRAAAGSLPVPAPHFLRGPAGGAGARPSGQVGAQVGAQAGGAGAGREGAAARARDTWPCCLRHRPHLAGRRSRDPLAGRAHLRRRRPRTAHPARRVACGFGAGVAWQ